MSHKDYLNSQNHTMVAVADIWPQSPAGRRAITSKYNPGTGSRVNTIVTEDQKPRLIYRDTDSDYIADFGSTNINEGPNLYAVTSNYNGTRSEVNSYLNGTVEASDSSSNPIYLNSAPVSIGTVRWPGGSYSQDFWEIEGEIGEIIYYNKTLNSSEMEEVESYLSEKWDLGIE